MNTNPGANNADFDIYDQLRQEIRHLKSEVVSLSEQNVDLALQLGQVDELNLTVAEQKSMLKSLRQEIQQREEELAQKRGSWQNVEERLKESEEQLRSAQHTITSLNQNNSALKEQVRNLELECAKLKATTKSQTIVIGDLTRNLSKAQAENARHSAALESLKDSYMREQTAKALLEENSAPLMRIEKALVDIVGTAGQVIFKRACRYANIGEEDRLQCSLAKLQEAATAALVPALRLCRTSELSQQLKDRIVEICKSQGPISARLEMALQGSLPSSEFLSAVPAAPLAAAHIAPEPQLPPVPAAPAKEAQREMESAPKSSAPTPPAATEAPVPPRPQRSAPLGTRPVPTAPYRPGQATQPGQPAPKLPSGPPQRTPVRTKIAPGANFPSNPAKGPSGPAASPKQLPGGPVPKRALGADQSPNAIKTAPLARSSAPTAPSAPQSTRPTPERPAPEKAAPSLQPETPVVETTPQVAPPAAEAAPVAPTPEPEVKAETKPQAKAEVKTEAKTEAKAEVKAEAKPEVKAEVPAAAKTEIKREEPAPAEPTSTDGGDQPLEETELLGAPESIESEEAVEAVAIEEPAEAEAEVEEEVEVAASPLEEPLALEEVEEVEKVDSAELPALEPLVELPIDEDEDEELDEVEEAETAPGISYLLNGSQKVHDTYTPNRILSNKLTAEFEEAFQSVLSGSQAQFRDPIVDLISKMTWNPGQIEERQRNYAKPKQLNKVSPTLIRSSSDPELDQIVTWLNYYVLSTPTTSYNPAGVIDQLQDVQQRQEPEFKTFVEALETLNKRIARKDRLELNFCTGPYPYFCHSQGKRSLVYANMELLKALNPAQQTFLATRCLLSLQRNYCALLQSVESVRQQEDYDTIEFGTTQLKRTVSSALERSNLPSDLLSEVQSSWSLSTKEELYELIDRCYQASDYVQFTYVKEFVANPYPFRHNVNLEGDTFALKFCNIFDASLAIATLLSGPERAQHFAQEGFSELFLGQKGPQTYLQQRIKNLWLSYYQTSDEVTAF